MARPWEGIASGSLLIYEKFAIPVSWFTSSLKDLIHTLGLICFLWFVTGSTDSFLQRSSDDFDVTRAGPWVTSLLLSIHLIAVCLSFGAPLPNYWIGPIWEFRKVFLSRSSSQAKVGCLLLNSSHLLETYYRWDWESLASYADSWWMKVALISRSGLLEFKNSRAFSNDHLYFRMM
jgi:hypothetical protein